MSLLDPTTLGVVLGGTVPVPAPLPGFVRFRCTHEFYGLVAELNGHVLVSGYAQHDTTARDGKVGITDYTGRAPLSLKIPLLLDRARTAGSVEDEIATLEQLHGVGANLADDARAPQIIVEGIGIPHSFSRRPDLRWVLSGDPEWDVENTATRGTDGHRTYVPVVVTALQDTRPTTLTAPETDDSKAPSTVTVAKGSKLNTLRAIAKHRKMKWTDLRALNPSLPGDPNHTLKPGTKVRVA